MLNNTNMTILTANTRRSQEEKNTLHEKSVNSGVGLSPFLSGFLNVVAKARENPETKLAMRRDKFNEEVELLKFHKSYTSIVLRDCPLPTQGQHKYERANNRIEFSMDAGKNKCPSAEYGQKLIEYILSKRVGNRTNHHVEKRDIVKYCCATTKNFRSFAHQLRSIHNTTFTIKIKNEAGDISFHGPILTSLRVRLKTVDFEVNPEFFEIHSCGSMIAPVPNKLKAHLKREVSNGPIVDRIASWIDKRSQFSKKGKAPKKEIFLWHIPNKQFGAAKTSTSRTRALVAKCIMSSKAFYHHLSEIRSKKGAKLSADIEIGKVIKRITINGEKVIHKVWRAVIEIPKQYSTVAPLPTRRHSTQANYA